MTADRKWFADWAADFLRHVIDEKLSDDEIHQWMETYFQRPFTTDDATVMRLAMHDAVSDR